MNFEARIIVLLIKLTMPSARFGKIAASGSSMYCRYDSMIF
ncbi:MAG TPA: hypothetical protein VF604_11840 [Pyrinomonadaceae bacterium]